MAAGRYTSRVFACGKALHAKIGAASIPPHTTTGDAVPVHLSPENPTGSNEYISVLLNSDETTTEWRRLSPPGRDELIVHDVMFRSVVPGVETSEAMYDRLAEVAAGIEGVAYDTSIEQAKVLGVDGEVWTRVRGVQPFVTPTDEGWIGSVVVSFETFASI